MFHAGAYGCTSAACQVLELRTSLSLARLWRLKARSRQAYELLVPVYDWFPERSDTLDLREAKTLLNELAA